MMYESRMNVSNDFMSRSRICAFFVFRDVYKYTLLLSGFFFSKLMTFDALYYTK